MILMVTTAVNRMLCLTIEEAVSSSCYSIVGPDPEDSLPQVVFRPIHHTKRVPPRVDLTNPAVLMLVFRTTFIELVSFRPTNTRTVASFHYEDPLLFEKLTDALARFDICLRV